MMGVETWLAAFVDRHIARCPRADWPEPRSVEEREFFGVWLREFARLGVEVQAADLASWDVAAAAPRFLSDHLPALTRRVLERRAEQSTAAPVPEGCDDCDGTGLAIRWVNRTRLACACVCPAGLARVASGITRLADFPILQLRPVDWAGALPGGLDNRHRYPPGSWDAEAGRPVAPTTPIRSVADLRAATVALGRSATRAGTNRPSSPNEARQRASRALPGNPPIDDPVLAREFAPRPDPPAPPPMPDPLEGAEFV